MTRKNQAGIGHLAGSGCMFRLNSVLNHSVHFVEVFKRVKREKVAGYFKEDYRLVVTNW